MMVTKKDVALKRRPEDGLSAPTTRTGNANSEGSQEGFDPEKELQKALKNTMADIVKEGCLEEVLKSVYNAYIWTTERTGSITDTEEKEERIQSIIIQMVMTMMNTSTEVISLASLKPRLYIAVAASPQRTSSGPA